MTTINQELDSRQQQLAPAVSPTASVVDLSDASKIGQERLSQQLAQSVNQTLANHQQQLQLEQEQIKCLTQLLNSCSSSGLDLHCVSAIARLTELLDRHQQSATQVYNVLNTLTQSKDAQYLTLDSQGEIATCLKLELVELATRLGIAASNNLLTAANNAQAWSKLMGTYPDPDGYQWQFPSSKRGFFHKTHLHAVGTKTVTLVTGSSLN